MNLVGQIFDQRYEILDLLGSGGLATVYKAQQMEIGRIVALKLLHARFSNDHEFKARFLQEAQTLNKLSHPNIVSIYHIGCAEDETLYIVMELAEGRSLAQILNEVDRLETLTALDYIKTLADALSYIHKNGIIHRDLKASNIIICDQGGRSIPKLIDFGLSKVDFQTQRLTATGDLIGTPDYMSPEQCRGQRIDASSDVYSLTVCLFDALTGRKPYEADTPVGIIFQHMNEPIPLIKPNDVQQFHPKLNQLIAKGMAKRPADRFASMNEMADAITLLRNEMFDRPNSSTSAPKQQRMIILAIIAAAILIPAVFFYIDRDQSKTSTEEIGTKDNTTVIPISVSALLDYGSTPNIPLLARELSSCRAYSQLSQKGSPVPQSVRIRAQRYFAMMLSEDYLPATALRLCQKLLKEHRKLTIGATAEGNPAVDYNYIGMSIAATLLDFGEKEAAKKTLFELLHAKNLSVMNRAGLSRELLKVGEVEKVRDLSKKAQDTRDLAELSQAYRAFGFDQESIACGIKAAEAHIQPYDFEYAFTLSNRAKSYFLEGKAELAHEDALQLWNINDGLEARRYRLDTYLASLARLFAMLGDYDHAILALCKICEIESTTKDKQLATTKREVLKLIRTEGPQKIPGLIKDMLHSKFSPQEKCELLYEAGKQYWPYRSIFDAIAIDIIKKAPETSIDKKMHVRFLRMAAADSQNAGYNTLAIKYYDELLGYIQKYGFIESDDPELSFTQAHETQMSVLRMLATISRTSSSEAETRLRNVLSKKDWQSSSAEILQIAYWFDLRDIIDKVAANPETASNALNIAKVSIRRNDLKTTRFVLDKAQQMLNQNPDHDLQIQYYLLEACYHIEGNELQEATKFLIAIKPLHVELTKDLTLRDELCRTYALCLMLTGLDDQRRGFTKQLCKLEGFQAQSKWIVW